MRNKLLFAVSAAGLLAGIVAAAYFGIKRPPLPPAFQPAENPYPNGIYAQGIIESVQPSASNLNVFPEETGVVTRVLVAEGQAVDANAPLVQLDDSVPRAQADSAQASLKLATDTLAKTEASYAMDPRSVSRDFLDTARNNAIVARANYKAAAALLAKYTLRAPAAGVVLSVNVTMRSYVSPQGVYDTYTQGYTPALVIGTPPAGLQLRCYVDEILLPRLPPPEAIKAQMAIRGSDVRIPLQFVRIQPYVSPKIELSDEKQELVDVRVLPVIFRFTAPGSVRVFPGQLVDVYIGQ